MRCPICYDDMGCSPTVLGCGHTFHNVCITEWLCICHTCPICRQRVPTDPVILSSILDTSLSSEQLMSLIFSSYTDEKLIYKLFKYRRLSSHDIALLVALGYVTDEWLVSDIREHFSYV